MDLFKHTVRRGARDCYQTERGPGPRTGKPTRGAEDRSRDPGCVICAGGGREGTAQIWLRGDGWLGNPEESKHFLYLVLEVCAAPTTTAGEGRFPLPSFHGALNIGVVLGKTGRNHFSVIHLRSPSGEKNGGETAAKRH